EIITYTTATLGFFACLSYIILTPANLKSVGDITIFLVIFPQSFSLLQTLATSISNLYQNNVFVESIFDLLNLKPSLKEVENPEVIEKNLPVNLSFHNVSFYYPNTNKKVLKNISFKIKSKQIIAIVGMNGAGKTSLIKLLCRFYDPTGGFISMDGKDIKKYSINDYRK